MDALMQYSVDVNALSVIIRLWPWGEDSAYCHVHKGYAFDDNHKSFLSEAKLRLGWTAQFDDNAAQARERARVYTILANIADGLDWAIKTTADFIHIETVPALVETIIVTRINDVVTILVPQGWERRDW